MGNDFSQDGNLIKKVGKIWHVLWSLTDGKWWSGEEELLFPYFQGVDERLPRSAQANMLLGWSSTSVASVLSRSLRQDYLAIVLMSL